MPTEIIVTGCGDCPMYQSVEVRGTTWHKCKAKKFGDYTLGFVQNQCPLPTDSITIKLKQDETHKTDVRGSIAQQ